MNKKCAKCQTELPAHTKGKLCQSCFDEWKAQMIADGKWEERPSKHEHTR